MAYAMTKRGSLDNCITYEFMCDTVEDMNAIEDRYRTIGSVAIVLQGESDGLEVYIAGSDKNWNSLSSVGANSSVTGGLSIYICGQAEVDQETGLPDIEEPDETSIYLVPAGVTSGNLYEEYIYVNDAWEKFGIASIDLSNYIQKTDIATQSTAGLVKVLDNGNVTLNENNQLVLTLAGTAVVKTGQSDHPISVTHQHEAAFYGLAKAAGQDMKNSDNAVGTYTTEAASAIRNMIGAGTYSKPAGGIPAADLADTYLTSHQDISGKANSADLATVAITGSYNDLLNTPTIPDTSAFATIASVPTKLSQLQNDIQGTIYGFHIDGDESDPTAKITYLADAVGKTPAHMDFANDKFEYGGWENAFFMPRPCMLKYDGTVDYYLDPTDYSKKVDGTASDISNTSYEGNAMMEWGRDGKKIWYNIVPEGNDHSSASIYIADYQVNQNYKAYSFIDKNNNYIDHFYTPCYFGTIVNDGSKDVLRSLSGQAGSSRCKNKTATVERTMAQNNGADWDMEFYCDIVLINLLLILMSKSTNTQAIFGEGLHTGGSDTVNDNFTSGQHDAKGLFYGTNSGTATTYTNAVKVFGMENWYGFMWRRFLGLVAIDRVIKYKMTANTADGSTGTDYIVSTTDSAYNTYLAGNTMPSAKGAYIQKMYFDEKQFAPQTAGGTYQQDYCDGLWTNPDVLFAYRSGYSNSGSQVGAFFLSLDPPASYAHWGVGAASSCKPHKIIT